MILKVDLENPLIKMISPKSKFFESSSSTGIESQVDLFLSKIDVRQIVKMEHGYGGGSGSTYFSCMIVYFENFSDVENLKAEGVVGGLFY